MGRPPPGLRRDAALHAIGSAPPPPLAGSPILPPALFGAADTHCAAAFPGAEPLCAAIVCHNVLRTLGRFASEVDSHGVDYNPAWFAARRAYWQARAPGIEAALLDLRSVPGERWGTWYHSFGVRALARGARGGRPGARR